MNKTAITVEATIAAPIQKVWSCWNEPEHIKQWAFASNDWHAPKAENDIRTGGKFLTMMAAKDGSFSFDFEGVYTHVEPNKVIEYKIADGREVKIEFQQKGNEVLVVESFEPEGTNPHEMQKGGWQAILDNFKKHVESQN